jgi:glutathione S-transferase
MGYVDINQAINADGLRLILVQGMPSAWGIAVKAMMEYKSLDFTLGPQKPMQENAELMVWSGTNSGPVVACNGEKPINRWDDILLLLERLAPEKPLVPQSPAERFQLFGIGHEICGELGFGWNRRLDMMRPPDSSEGPGEFAQKYNYRETEADLANSRVIAFMADLAEILKAQKGRRSDYIIGQSVTAADFYWAAFSNFVTLQPPEIMPIDPAVRPMFENTPAEITAAIDPILMEHRDRIMKAYFKIPHEL